MNRKTIAVLACLLAPACAWARPAAGELGAGLLLGDPLAGTGKYFFDERQAVDFGLGVSDNFTLIGDYSYHAWELLPQPKKGDLAVYGSLGGRLETERYNNLLLRMMLGLSYWPRFKRPFEFFLEMGPGMRIAPDQHWRVEGGFGLRAYFLASSAKR